METSVEAACHSRLLQPALFGLREARGKRLPRTSFSVYLTGLKTGFSKPWVTAHARAVMADAPAFPHLGTPESPGDEINRPRTLAQPWPGGRNQRGHRASGRLRGHVVPFPSLGGPLGPVERPLPMCCVSSCTAGISLRGMWPVPPSLQQRRQHHADAAMAQQHSPAAPPAPECSWVAGASQTAQRRRVPEAKPRQRRGPGTKNRGPDRRGGAGPRGGRGQRPDRRREGVAGGQGAVGSRAGPAAWLSGRGGAGGLTEGEGGAGGRSLYFRGWAGPAT